MKKPISVSVEGFRLEATLEDGGWFLEHEDCFGNVDACFGPYYGCSLADAKESVAEEIREAGRLLAGNYD